MLETITLSRISLMYGSSLTPPADRRVPSRPQAAIGLAAVEAGTRRGSGAWWLAMSCLHLGASVNPRGSASRLQRILPIGFKVLEIRLRRDEDDHGCRGLLRSWPTETRSCNRPGSAFSSVRKKLLLIGDIGQLRSRLADVVAENRPSASGRRVSARQMIDTSGLRGSRVWSSQFLDELGRSRRRCRPQPPFCPDTALGRNHRLSTAGTAQLVEGRRGSPEEPNSAFLLPGSGRSSILNPSESADLRLRV